MAQRQTHHVQTVGIPVRIRARRLSDPLQGAAAPRTPCFTGRGGVAYAAASRAAERTGSTPVLMWVRIPPPGPSWGGRSRRAEDTALSARKCGFESRRPRQDGPVVQGETPALQAGDEGSIPSGSTNEAIVQGRRISGLQPGDAGSSPAGLTSSIVVVFVVDAEGRDGDLPGLMSLGMRVRFPPPRPQPVRSMGGLRSYKPLTGVRFPHRLPPWPEPSAPRGRRSLWPWCNGSTRVCGTRGLGSSPSGHPTPGS